MPIFRLGSLFSRGEVVFSDATERAYPVRRDVFEGRSGRDAAVRIPHLGVIDIAADVAYVFLHMESYYVVQGAISVISVKNANFAQKKNFIYSYG